MMNTCKTCAHWYTLEQDRPQTDGYRKCAFLTDADEDRPDGIFMNTDDGAAIWAGPDFGCVRHIETTQEAIDAALWRDMLAEAYRENNRRTPYKGNGLKLSDLSNMLVEHWLKPMVAQRDEPSPFFKVTVEEDRLVRFVGLDPTVKKEEKK